MKTKKRVYRLLITAVLSMALLSLSGCHLVGAHGALVFGGGHHHYSGQPARPYYDRHDRYDRHHHGSRRPRPSRERYSRSEGGHYRY